MNDNHINNIQLTKVRLEKDRITASEGCKTLSEIQREITFDEETKNITEAYQGAENVDDKLALKEQLSCYTVSGLYKVIKRRNPKEPSNIVKVTVSKFNQLPDHKQAGILNDEHIQLGFVDTNEDLQILVPVEQTIDNDKKYNEAHRQITSYYRNKYNIEPSNALDVPGIVANDITGIKTYIQICHDPEAIYNENATSFKEAELSAVTILKVDSNEEELDSNDENYRSDTEKLAEDIINRCVASVRNSQEGERNFTLNKSTFTIAGIWKAFASTYRSVFDREDLRKRLLGAASDCGLEEKEALGTLNSAWVSGENKPFKLFMLGYKPKVKPILDYETLKEYLDINFLAPYYDEIEHKIVCPKYRQNCGIEVSDLANCLLPDLTKIFNVPGARPWLKDILYQIGRETHKNIVVEELKKLKGKWDGKDHFSSVICSLLGLKKGSLAYMYYKKFFIQAIFVIHNELQSMNNQERYTPEFVLLVAGRQGLGKTKSFRHLLRFSEAFTRDDQRLYKEGGKFTSRDKDDRRRLLQGFVIEIGEVQTTFRQSDMEDLKAFITQDFDRYRLPFGQSDIESPRITSLVATANVLLGLDDFKDSNLLRDLTGNRRFAIVFLRKSFPYDKVSYDEIQQMWAQLYNTYWVDEEIRATVPYRFTAKERALQELNNETATASRKGDSEVEDILISSLNGNRWELMTCTEFLEWHKNILPSGLSSDSLGKTLSKIGIKTEDSYRNRYLPTSLSSDTDGCKRPDIRAVVENLDKSTLCFSDSNNIILADYPDIEEGEFYPDYVERLRAFAISNEHKLAGKQEESLDEEQVLANKEVSEDHSEAQTDEHTDFDTESLLNSLDSITIKA